MTRLKNCLAGLTLLFGSLLFTLLLLEGTARIFFPHDRDHVLPGRLFDIDPQLGWKLKANKQVVHNTRYFDVVYSTNSSGVRDVERQPAKKEGIYRVLLYGDSQVFGWGVPVDKRFSYRLEASDAALEIWNFAIPAYGLDQQVLAYQHSSDEIEADEVVFFVSNKTLRRTRSDFMYGKPKPVFKRASQGRLSMVPPKEVGKTRLLYEVINPFYLPYVVQRRLQILQAMWEEKEEERGVDPGGTRPRGGVREVEKEMLRLARDIAAERGQKMTVLVEVAEDIGEGLRDFCRREGMGFLAIDFGLPVEKVIFGKGDAHWTPNSHRIAAEQIIDQVNWSSVRVDLTGGEER